MLMSVKSMQSRHLSFAFLMTTTLANHSGYSTSLIAFAWRSLPTSSLIALCLSGAKLLLFCSTGLKERLTFNLWVITAGSTPPMSSCFQANTSMFCSRKRTREFLMSSANLDPRLACRARPCRCCRPCFASLMLNNIPWLCACFLKPFLLHL